MSDSRDRFLREIASRIPAERLVEVHLFPPIKQGAVESGVAVVAASHEAAAADVPPPLPAFETGAEPPAAEAIVRHTVYTARYRATLKGADRGKWEFSLVAEADAPLVTIDAVVRGVQRRSADSAEPERLTPESLPTRGDATWTISTR